MRRRAALAATCLLLGLGGCRDDTPGAAGATTTEPASTRPAGPERSEPDLVVRIEGRPSAIGYGAGALWVADDGRGVVHRLDPVDGAPLGPPIAVTPAPVALAVGAGRVWVVDPAGTLAGIDAVAPEEPVLSVPLGGALVDVVVHGDRVWVGDVGAGTIQAVDAATGVPSPPIEVPGGVVRLAVDGDRLWVSGLEQTVTPVEVATGVVGAPRRVGAAPIGMAAAGGGLWVANSDDDTVARLDPGDVGSAPTWAVGSAPIEVLVDGDDVWVLEQDAASLTRYPAAGPGPGGPSTALPTRPRAMAVTAAGIWVAGVDASVVVLIRT